MSIQHRCAETAAALMLLFVSACSSTQHAAGVAPDGGSCSSCMTAPGSGGAGGADAHAHVPHGLSLIWRIVESGPVGIEVDAGRGGAGTATSALPGLPGAKICVYQNTAIPCVTSGADGTFTLEGLPSLAHLVLTSEKKDYVRSIRAIETASTDMDNTAAPMVTTKASAPRPDLGIPFDDTKGAVSFFALEVAPDGGLILPHGVKVSLSPNTADGPFFSTARNTFVKGATTTVGGLGFFFNVEPGDYELTFENAEADCAPISFPLGAWGFPTPPTSVRFPVLSGYVTDQVGVLCTQKSTAFTPDGGDASAP